MINCIISASLAIRIAERSSIVIEHSSSPSVRTCVLWQNGSLDLDAVWGGEWGGPRHSCVRWKSTCLKGKGLFLAWFLAFFGISACIGFNRPNDAEKCIRLVCEKLTVFPYARYTVEFCVAFPFLWCSQVQDRSGGWREIHVEKCIITITTRPLRRSDNAAAVPAAMSAAAQSIPAGITKQSRPFESLPWANYVTKKGDVILSTEERRTLLKLLWGLVISVERSDL